MNKLVYSVGVAAKDACKQKAFLLLMFQRVGLRSGGEVGVNR